MSPQLQVAFVALGERCLPTASQIAHNLQAHWPDEPPPTDPHRQEDTLTFSLGEDLAAVTLMPTPIPWADLEGPCAVAWYWPEATEVLRRHTAHLVVTLGSNTEDKVTAALTLTRLTAAVAEAAAALGIYWGAGRLVHDRKAFLDMGRDMGRENLPLFLWIDFRIQREDGETLTLFTTGMAAFGQREIEIWNSRREPQFLLERAYSFTHYLLDRNVTLQDGETIGLSPTERIPIQVGPSKWDEKLAVTRLML